MTPWHKTAVRLGLVQLRCPSGSGLRHLRGGDLKGPKYKVINRVGYDFLNSTGDMRLHDE